VRARWVWIRTIVSCPIQMMQHIKVVQQWTGYEPALFGDVIMKCMYSRWIAFPPKVQKIWTLAQFRSRRQPIGSQLQSIAFNRTQSQSERCKGSRQFCGTGSWIGLSEALPGRSNAALKSCKGSAKALLRPSNALIRYL
jgi:hypothetical protein